MSKKISIITVAIIIVISLAISIYIPNRDKIETEKEDTSINYSIIEKEGKKGIVEGENVIIETQYEEMDDEVKEFINILSDDDLKEEDSFNEVKETTGIDMDKVESIIKLPKDKTLEEELKVVPIDSEDDKIAKAIAKEHLDNVKANSNLAEFLDDEYNNPDDDTSWVNGPDLFGNDIDVIIADDPNKEFEDTNFVEGSFSQWLADNQ